MNMNKKILLFIITLFSFFFVKNNVYAIDSTVNYDDANHKVCFKSDASFVCLYKAKLECQVNGSKYEVNIPFSNTKNNSMCPNPAYSYAEGCVTMPADKIGSNVCDFKVYTGNSRWNKEGDVAFNNQGSYDDSDYYNNLTSEEKAKINKCSQYATNACPKKSCYVSDGNCVDVCPQNTYARDGRNCEAKVVEHVADKPCQDNDVKKVFRLFGYLLVVAKILVPLIIIVVGTFDIFKAVTSQDDKSLTKQLRILVWRIIGGLTIFFLPTIVGAFFTISSDINVTEDEDYKICANCLLDPFNKQVCNVNDDDTVTSSTTTTTTTKASRVQGTGGTASQTGGSGYSGGGTGGGSR